MKNYLKFIPIQLTLFLVFGILIQYFFELDSIYIISSILVSLVLLVIFYYKSKKDFLPKLNYNYATYLTFFFVGALTMFIHTDKSFEHHYTNYLNQTNNVTLTITEELKEGFFNRKFIANVNQIEDKQTFGKVLINLKKDSLLVLNLNDRLFINADFLEIPKPKNPYQFDYKNYLERQQIEYQMYLTNQTFYKFPNASFSFSALASNFRNRVNESLKKNGFSGNELGVINALLLGQRQDISKELLESYAGAGAIHILAVSGLHVGIILLILNFLFSPISRVKNGKLIKLILVVSFLWIFAFIAGLSPSVVRAVTMFTAVAIGMQFKRPTNIYNTLIISMFVLLLFNPYFLFEVGFQLSYIAVFAIVWIQPLLYNIFSIKIKLLDFFWKIFTVSVAAQIGVLPLSLYYFHQFPSLFFISNLLIIPILGIILGVGILVIFLSLFDLLSTSLATIYSNLIYFMNSVVEWVAHQESFLFKNITYTFLLMLSTYLSILFFIQFVKYKSYTRFVSFSLALIVVSSVLIFEKYQLRNNNEIIVFHKSRYSILGIKNGDELAVFHDLDSVALKNDKLINQYKVGVGGINISIDSFQNIYEFDNKKVVIIDSLGVYQFKSLKPDIVLLQQSPKINLARLIDSLKPKIIIADGSNFKSYVKRWSETCIQKNTPFHSTLQKGAYILKE